MKKVIAVLLLSLLTLIPMVSCADTNDAGDTESEGVNTENGEVNDTETTVPVFDDEVLEVPDESFDHEFVILTPSIVTYCYALNDFDEPSDDAYENAFYERNLVVEEKLGITISQVESNIGNDVYSRFKTDVESGTYTYDICFNNMTMSCAATGAGLCYDIDSMDYINLDKAWWNDDATEQLSLGNLHYMIAGDISLSDKEGIWATYFIKEHIESNGLENPYELVANNEWTLDKMYEMAEKVAFDENADGTMDKNDMWGLCTHHENWAATWQSAGLKLIQVNEDGIPEAVWGTEEFVNVYEKMAAILGDQDVVSRSDVGFITTALKNGNTLFGTEIVAFIRDYRNNEHEFGIVPYPKFDSSVPEYYSFIVTNACVMTVPKSCDDTYRTSIIVETMAAKGREILLPAYYEGQLKSRYSRDEESSAMLDIIFEHRSYDLGVFFDWGGAYSQLQSPEANPATLFPALERTTNKSIEKSLSKLGIY